MSTSDNYHHSYKAVQEVILRSHDEEWTQVLKEKVACQDWEGGIALALVTSNTTNGTSARPDLLGDEEEQRPLLNPSQEGSFALSSRQGYASIQSKHQPIQLTKEQQLCGFREMMIGILSSSSRTIETHTTSLIQHRRVLSRNLYSVTRSPESGITTTRVFLEFLDTYLLNDALRGHSNVQNAIVRKRYDLLAQFEYMDCGEVLPNRRLSVCSLDDVPRASSKVSIEEGGGRNDKDEDIWSSSMECCAICLGSIQNKGEEEMTTLPSCNHGFCTKCIQEWAEHTSIPSCPTCREPIPSPNIVSTSTTAVPVPAPQERDNQHPRGERLRQLRQRQEQRQERGKCVGILVLFFFFCTYVLVFILPTQHALRTFSSVS